MWDWHGGPDGWGWLWMGLMMIVWLPLLVLLVWALRQFGQTAHPPPAPPREPDRGAEAESDALEIARRRYARGEVDREQYLQIIEDLQLEPLDRRTRATHVAAAPPSQTSDPPTT